MAFDPATRTNVTINGQAGDDALIIDDSAFTTENVAYSSVAASGILPDRIVRSAGPLSVRSFGYKSLQSVVVNGGAGSDVFRLEMLQSGIALQMNGGVGNDSLEVTPADGRLEGNLTNAAFFGYDGGPVRNRSNGSNVARVMGLTVNGAAWPGGVTFRRTGDWATWQEVSAALQLTAGANRIRLTTVGQSGPNLDSLTVAG